MDIDLTPNLVAVHERNANALDIAHQVQPGVPCIVESVQFWW